MSHVLILSKPCDDGTPNSLPTGLGELSESLLLPICTFSYYGNLVLFFASGDIILEPIGARVKLLVIDSCSGPLIAFDLGLFGLLPPMTDSGFSSSLELVSITLGTPDHGYYRLYALKDQSTYILLIQVSSLQECLSDFGSSFCPFSFGMCMAILPKTFTCDRSTFLPKYLLC